MDYASPFLALPSYSLTDKRLYREDREEPMDADSGRIAMNVLRKRLPGTYDEEQDG